MPKLEKKFSEWNTLPLGCFIFIKFEKLKFWKKNPNFRHFWPASIASNTFLVAKSVSNSKIKVSGNEILLLLNYSMMTLRKSLADLGVVLSTNSVIHRFTPFNDFALCLNGWNSSKNQPYAIKEGHIQLFSAISKFKMT